MDVVRSSITCWNTELSLFHVTTVQEQDDTLTQKMELMWKTDFSDSLSNPMSAMSIEDKRALQMMESSLVHENNRYKVSLPWRNDPNVLPNNVSLARSRLSMLKRRLEKDDVLHSPYSKAVQDYIDKGFARRVTPEEANDSEAWYIPHHAVVNPNKPGKTRVVFDFAAKFKGVSLNDNLLHGPDVVNSLISVLIRFRHESVAVLADMEAMLHQVMK